MADGIPLQIYEKQGDFRTSTALVRGFAAGIGAGKTWIGALDLLKKAKAGRHYMVIAPTYGMLRDAAWRTFREVAGMLERIKQERRSSPMESVITTEDGGDATILFRSADEPEHLRGPNLSGIWIDESSIVSEEAYLIALGRLREAGELGWLSMTFTPKGRSHWTYGIFYDTVEGVPVARDDAYLVNASTLDNPFVDKAFYDSLISRYSEQMASQEVEGNFVDIGSGIVSREMFGTPLSMTPDCIRVCRAWDKAGTAGGKGACTAGVKIGLTVDDRYVVLNVVRGRWSAIEREREILRTANADDLLHGHTCTIIVEQEPGSGGKESAEATIRMLDGFDVQRFIPGGKGSKMERADPFIAQVQGGNVGLVQGAWNQDYLDEWGAFPDGLMDQCDSSAMAHSVLSRRGQGLTVERDLFIDLDARKALLGGKPTPVHEIIVTRATATPPSDMAEFINDMDD